MEPAFGTVARYETSGSLPDAVFAAYQRMEFASEGMEVFSASTRPRVQLL